MTSTCKMNADVHAKNQRQQLFPYCQPENKFSTTVNFYIQKPKLTKKEILCLELYLQGMTMREIGKKLYRSHRTIESHIKNIKEKLNATSRSEVFSVAKNWII